MFLDIPGMFLGVPECSRVFRDVIGCSGLFQCVLRCSGDVPRMFRGVPGMFKGCKQGVWACGDHVGPMSDLCVIYGVNGCSDAPVRRESGIWRSRDALCDATGKRIWSLGVDLTVLRVDLAVLGVHLAVGCQGCSASGMLRGCKQGVWP